MPDEDQSAQEQEAQRVYYYSLNRRFKDGHVTVTMHAFEECPRGARITPSG